MTTQELDDLFDQIPSLAEQPRTIEELSGGLTNLNLKVTTPSGVYVARLQPERHVLARHRPGGRARELPGGRARRRGRTRHRLPPRPGRPGDRVHRRPHLRQRRPATTGRAPPGRGGGPHAARRPAIRRRLRHVHPAAALPRLDRRRRLRASGRLHRVRRAVPADPRGARRQRRPHRAVQQRPAGGQLRRRRREALADRLRVLRQQRPLLRAGQHLDRVRARRRPPRGAGDGVRRAPRTGDRSPGPGSRPPSPGTAGRSGATSRPRRPTTTTTSTRWGQERYEAAVEDFRSPEFGRLLDTAAGSRP